jgi:hypothetical protein
MKFSYIPPKLELGKAWQGLNRNQCAAREHDEQYQMLAGIRVSSDLRQKK